MRGRCARYPAECSRVLNAPGLIFKMRIDLAPAAAPSTIEATYKSREVEGWIDIHFYRKLGFRLANFFAKLKMTPAAVSLLGCLFGVVAGHLYYYHNLSANIAGMA